MTPVTLTAQTTKQQQKVMDLETGNEGATIEVVMTKYIAPKYKEEFGSESDFNSAVFNAALELVPENERTQALLNYATSASYQAGKAAALAGGNYLTPELKAKIVQVMRGNQAFVDLSASDCFKKWAAGFAAKKPGALKILDLAKSVSDLGDDL